jgi:hypothetical protein
MTVSIEYLTHVNKHVRKREMHGCELDKEFEFSLVTGH